MRRTYVTRNSTAMGFLVAVIALCLAMPVCVEQAAGTELNVLWDFDRLRAGELLNQGNTLNGSSKYQWSVLETEHALSPPKVLSPSNTHQSQMLFLGPGVTIDAEVSVSFRAPKGSSPRQSGLVWGAQDSSNFYVAVVHPLKHSIIAYRVIRGNWTSLDNAKYVEIPQQWHTLRAIVLGNRFVITVDGRAVMDMRDDTFTGGYCGIWSAGKGVIYFDNFRIEGLK